MNSEKIIFLDIDGTLIDYTQKLPDSAREAIHLAQARGHKLLISTGRSKPAIYPWLFELGFDGMIAGAGAYAEFGGKIVSKAPSLKPKSAAFILTLKTENLVFTKKVTAGSMVIATS